MPNRPRSELSWSQVRHWRLRRQAIDPRTGTDAVSLIGALCGVQAQVLSAAELAVALRSVTPSTAGVATGLTTGKLVRTWTARGTLHALPPQVAARQLSVLAAARSWHRPSWQRTFATLPVMAALAEQAHHALAVGPLTRDELVAALDVGADPQVAERLRSGWGSLLKPLAWQGVLCQGPPRGRNVTFVRPDLAIPDWPGLSDDGDAGPSILRDYLHAFGPGTVAAFDNWLLRGTTPKSSLRRWFDLLGDEITPVQVDGRPALALVADLDELSDAPPARHRIHLLPAFDQYVLGPGTTDGAIVPAEHRSLVSRAGGWISPVVLLDGQVVGTWEAAPDDVRVAPFPGVDLPAAELAEAVEQATRLLAAVRHATAAPLE